MDEYNNQNQYPDNHNRGSSPDSPYDNNRSGQNQPQQPWQNGQNPNSQGSQWQNGQTDSGNQWQNGQTGGGNQWQNGQADGGNQWQNGQTGGGNQWQNNQGSGQWQNNQFYGQQPQQRNGKALASMIFGILALLSCCIPFIQFPLAVVAIVLVILSKKKQPLTGFAIAGLVLGIISVIISIAMTFYWGYAISLMNDPEFIDMYNDMMKMYQ